jgi:hypothetical protein
MINHHLPLITMPPKKKDKPNDTCDAGTDPPPPLDYDPFDDDGLGIAADFKSIMAKVQEALTKLRQQSTTGAPKTIKDDVVLSLETALK